VIPSDLSTNLKSNMARQMPKSHQKPKVTHHAILIGINLYPGEKWDQLEGAVRDVEEISNVLSQRLPSASQRLLKASRPGDISTQGTRPTESREVWPTYENVVGCVKQVTSDAQPGDFVYMHYSGHGTALPPSGPYSNSATGDLALALLHENPETRVVGLRYLRGIELAYLLEGMVKKGLTVTLVLDTCASGSTQRDEESVRCLSYNRVVDAAYPPSLGGCPAASSGTVNFASCGSRDASMRPSWLVDPDGYTILTACGPTEKAYELKDEKGEKHGTLSYFLLRAFTLLGGVGGRLDQVYQHLRVQLPQSRLVRDRKAIQNPMLYGNKTAFFFGSSPAGSCSGDIPIVRNKDAVDLQAGVAQGICIGDCFELRPLRPGKNKEGVEMTPVTATVEMLGALTSRLRVVGDGEGSTSTTMQTNRVRTGWLAVALTRLSLKQFPVQLAIDRTNREEESKWEMELKQRESLNINIDGDSESDRPFSIRVTLNEAKQYEIRDGSALNAVPIWTSSTDGPSTQPAVILNVVQHFAWFKFVRGLTSVSMSNRFRNSFSAAIVKKNGESFSPGCEGDMQVVCTHPECAMESEQEQEFELLVKNLEEPEGSSLYVHVYNMGSRWQIKDILGGNYEVNPPRGSNMDEDDFPRGTEGEWRRKLRMSVPKELIKQGKTQCEDVIKVFLTRQPTSFTSLALPILGNQVTHGGVELKEKRDAIVSDDWAVLSFRVRTTYKPK
jgi:hypothetical protein